MRSKSGCTCSSQNQSDVIPCGPVRAPHCAKNEVEERGQGRERRRAGGRAGEKVAVSEIPSPCTNLELLVAVAVAWSVGRLLNNKKEEERRVNNGEWSGGGDSMEGTWKDTSE